MKYTVGTISKALVAFGVATIGAATAAAHGADLSGLDFGSWMTCLGAGLVAGGGVFATPNKADATPPVADQAIEAIKATVQVAVQAQSEVDKVRQAATDVLNTIPVLGPLASQAINSLPRF